MTWACERCSRPLAGRGAFLLESGWRCLRCALTYRPLLYRSARTAAVVGTILVGINVAPSLLTNGFVSGLWRIPLNYAVPFCVATWGALSNSRRHTPH